jgi:hypothetical protein
MWYTDKGRISVELRDDLLWREITSINNSWKCKSCKHLGIFHYLDSDGCESFCDIEDCDCYYDEGEWKIAKPRKVQEERE